MSNVLQIQFITGCSSWCRCQHPKKNTQTNTCTHSSHSHHCLRRRILKVCFFTKLGRGGRIFSFSPLSSRCVFARESGAVQARSFHYHSEKRTPWNSPREARKAAFIIFFFHYCQNMLYFTFCSWRNFFSLTFRSLSFCLCPIWMLRCLGCFFVLSVHTYDYWFCVVLKSSICALQEHTGSKCNQMPIFILSNEPLANNLDLLS